MAGKILIIDDDRDITQIIRILLEGEGFETCTAYSGTQALASLDETVELIILDIMMDGMNGFEVCHRIRESSYVPILFLSAMSGDSEKVVIFRLCINYNIIAFNFFVFIFIYTKLITNLFLCLSPINTCNSTYCNYNTCNRLNGVCHN